MNKKQLLTSFVAIGFATAGTSAMGAYETVSTFPSTHMTKEKIYTNAATSTNTGKTSGTAISGAVYNLSKGYYFPSGSYAAAACPANSYCPGKGSVLRGPNNLDATGATACSTLTGYPSSAASATAPTDCYTACASLSSAVSVTFTSASHQYYGGGSTCEPSTCPTGYGIKGLSTGRSVITLGSNGCIAYANPDGSSDVKSVQVVGSQVNSAVASTECLNTAAGNGGYGLASSSASGGSGMWAVQHSGKYGHPGILYGQAKCVASSVSGDVVADGSIGSTSGPKCYCHFTGVKYIVNPINYALSDMYYLYQSGGQWMYASGYGTEANCKSDCAKTCALRYIDPTLGAAYLPYIPSTKMCALGVYDINYKCGTAKNGTMERAIGTHDTGYTEFGKTYTWADKGGCSANGFIFAGWSTTNGATTPTYTAGSTITWGTSSPTKLYAVWTPREGQAQFTTTGATDNTGINGKKVSVAVSVAMPTYTAYKSPVKKGYKFTGFYQNSDGTGTRYYKADSSCNQNTLAVSSGCSIVPDQVWDQEIETDNAIVPIYAAWTLRTDMTVKYSCGDGTGTAPDDQTSITYGNAFTTAANNKSTPCSKAGYTFKGWSNNNTNVDAAASYAAANWANSKLTKQGILTLTARYTVNAITINWYGTANTATVNGTSMGTCSGETTANANCKSSQVNYGGDVITPSAGATINGQSFLGWKFIK